MSRGRLVVLLWVGAALWLGATLAVAYGAEEGYCSIWAREATRIGLAEASDVDLATLTPDVIKYALSRNFSICLNADENPALPATPLASDSAWLEMAARNVRDKLGQVSAGAKGAGESAESSSIQPLPITSKYDPQDIAKCRRQFRSFDPKDNTVVERHHKRRQLCPLL